MYYVCKYLYMSCKLFSLKNHSKLARSHIHKHARTHAHTHAPISVHTHAFTSHIYYLNHVVCFTSCSCVMLCVFSFFAVLLSYMICTIMEEIKNIYMQLLINLHLRFKYLNKYAHTLTLVLSDRSIICGH